MKLTKNTEKRLAHYQPEKGLQRIAVTEVAEKHYARAKDAGRLMMAIRAKLEAQAEFVLWWDQKGPGTNHGGRRAKGEKQDIRSDILPDTLIVSRWRAKLNDPECFERTFETAYSKYTKILEFQTAGAHVGQNTGEQEWYTPAEIVGAAREVLGGIDLDPASHEDANHIIQAAQIFTAEDDGLTQPWDGRVWMNPPYAQPLISRFCEKLADSVEAGTVTAAAVLVNNATETQWFQALARVATAMCFPSGRVRFWSPGKEAATPLQGQTVIYHGPHLQRFCEIFMPFGFCVEVRR